MTTNPLIIKRIRAHLVFKGSRQMAHIGTVAIVAILFACSSAWVPQPLPLHRSIIHHHYTPPLYALVDPVVNLTESVVGDDYSELTGYKRDFSGPSRNVQNKDDTATVAGNVISTTSSLGDIMNSGLSTNPSPSNDNNNNKTLAQCYGIHHPLDRLALTANGNLQRLVASYYDSPVRVDVKSCSVSHNDTAVWNRVVHLQVFSQTFCVATSTIQVHDHVCQELVASGCVGIGQLFRFLNVLPEFQLLRAGPRKQGGFWRDYTLDCPEVTCRIHEEFEAHMWQMDRKNDDC